MQLFRKESDILVNVLEALRSIGIVSLPAHDAVAVRNEHKKNNHDHEEGLQGSYRDHPSGHPGVGPEDDPRVGP